MDNASCSQAIYFFIRKWRNEGKKTNPHCNLPKWKKELPWVPRHEEGIHFGDFLVWSKAMNVNKTISTVCLFVCLSVSFLFFFYQFSPAPAWCMFLDGVPSTTHQPTCTACRRHVIQGNGRIHEGLTASPWISVQRKSHHEQSNSYKLERVANRPRARLAPALPWKKKWFHIVRVWLARCNTLELNGLKSMQKNYEIQIIVTRTSGSHLHLPFSSTFVTYPHCKGTSSHKFYVR